MTFNVQEQGPAAVVAEAVGTQLAQRAQDVGQSPTLNALAQATRSLAQEVGADTMVYVVARGTADEVSFYFHVLSADELAALAASQEG